MTTNFWFLNNTTFANLEYCIEIATGRPVSGPVPPSSGSDFSDMLRLDSPSNARSVGWLTPPGFTSETIWTASLSDKSAELVWARQNSNAESFADLRASVGAVGGMGNIAAPAGEAEWRNYTDYQVQWLYLTDSYQNVSGKLDARTTIRKSLPAGVTYYGWIVSGFTGRMLRPLYLANLACQLTLDNQRIQA